MGSESLLLMLTIKIVIIVIILKTMKFINGNMEATLVSRAFVSGEVAVVPERLSSTSAFS